ncbi:hypothetical protein WOLCODRAFT_164270 [Wolfiporia cocos MD-104 SS10]|uniref:F-box domain-containing protein n=1 Tax=Wolfiporia cocos (strain MD-104) TaxID=742152 RepID=A0A2H3JW66_WOLCO|nr:hypothetical protein WOLCODRAFT_164270 [Wolfiporia cocos MD-104 SS10]
MSNIDQTLATYLSGLHLSQHAPHTPCRFLQLHPTAVSAIFQALVDSPRDVLSLAATCRYLSRFSAWAYLTLRLELALGDAERTTRTFSSLQCILGALKADEARHAAVREISLYRPARPRPHTQGMPADQYEYLLGSIDLLLTHIVLGAPNLRSFALDASHALGDGYVQPFPLTIHALLVAPRLEHLALVGVCCPRAFGNIPQAAASTGLRSVVLRTARAREDAAWVEAFLEDQPDLETLDLGVMQCTGAEWTAAAPRYLCGEVTQYPSNRALQAEHIVHHCLVAGAWPRLTSLSLSGGFVNLLLLEEWPLGALRHLRLVINVNGAYIEQIFSGMVEHILHFAPGLEELVLDHSGMARFVQPLDEKLLSGWGAAIRASKTLRRLVLPALFVPLESDATSQGHHAHETSRATTNEDVGHPEDDTEDEDGDVAMSDTSSQSVDDNDYIDADEEEEIPQITPSLDRVSWDLLYWAEELFNKHIRTPCLPELRFLYDNVDEGVRESLGFEPGWDETPVGKDGKATQLFCRRNGRRYALWWEPAERTLPGRHV